MQIYDIQCKIMKNGNLQSVSTGNSIPLPLFGASITEVKNSIF